jgi:transposase
VRTKRKTKREVKTVSNAARADSATVESSRYNCDDCGAELEYAGEQTRTPRGEWRSKYRCPNSDCSTEEVLLR